MYNTTEKIENYVYSHEIRIWHHVHWDNGCLDLFQKRQILNTNNNNNSDLIYIKDCIYN